MSYQRTTTPIPRPKSEITVFEDEEGEAFARAVFGRFLRQATICRDIDDAIEHMHIVNDNAQTFAIRLGGEARIPVGRELILALAAKKKELLALCESALRTPRSSVAVGSVIRQDGSRSTVAHPRPVIFPPPTALAATGCGAAAVPTAAVSRTNATSTAVMASGSEMRAVDATTKIAAIPPISAGTVSLKPEPTSRASSPAAYISADASFAARTQARQNEGPTTVFVRKVDTKLDKEDMVKHFQQFGEVTAISMNPTRGYAFVDFTSHDCVVRAVSAMNHRVGHRMLEVEMKKEVNPSSEPSRNNHRRR